MGKPQDEKDDVTPEALVCEAAASSAIDIKRKEEAPDDSNDVDEEKALAALPPDLARAVARNLALQPGAFREGPSLTLAAAENDQGDARNIRTAQESEYYNNDLYIDVALEATLVTEGNNTSTIASSSNGGDDNTVYKGEPMDDLPKKVVAIHRKWIWWIVGAALFLITVTCISVVLAVASARETEGMEPTADRTENTLLPTASPSSFSLAPYDRITHHVALIQFISSPTTCSAVQDRFLQSEYKHQVVAGAVTVTCGDRRHPRAPPQRGLLDDDDSTATALVPNMGGCERLSQDSVRCFVDHDRRNIVFTCGTHSRHYDTNTTSVTAAVLVDDTVAICNDSDDNTVRLDQGLPPVVAVFLAVGRFCQSDSFFRPMNSTCTNESDLAVASANNVTYCIQRGQPCDTYDCAVNLDHVLTQDVDTSSDCVADGVGASALDGNFFNANVQPELDQLYDQQKNFIADWMNGLNLTASSSNQTVGNTSTTLNA